MTNIANIANTSAARILTCARLGTGAAIQSPYATAGTPAAVRDIAYSSQLKYGQRWKS